MIAGVTHLTMEAELSHGVKQAAEWGFELDFMDEVALPAGFERVGDTDDILPLALLTAGQGIRLEIVRHRSRTGRPGAYSGIFRSPPPRLARQVTGRRELHDLLRRTDTLLAPACVVTEPHGAPAWFDTSSSAGGLAGIVSHTFDVDADTRFWSAFARARWEVVDAGTAWGALPSPLPGARCTFVITAADDTSGLYAMNDSGYPSMGVYSTEIEADCRRALSAGATLHAEPISATVHGRLLRIALIETPGGTPVELLSVPRNAVRRNED